MQPRIQIRPAAALCFLSFVLLPLAGTFLVNPSNTIAPSASWGPRACSAQSSSVLSSRPMVARCGGAEEEGISAPRRGFGLRMGEAFGWRRAAAIPSNGIAQHHDESRMFSRMTQLKLSGKVDAEGVQQDSKTADKADAAEDPASEKLKSLTKQLMKETRSPSTGRLGKKDGKSKSRNKPKAAKGEDDSQITVAFSAFSQSLLRPGAGRVRFSTISSTFREEFPTLAPESRISNQTLGRKLQSWYKEKTGNELKKDRTGAYPGLTIVNPRFTSVDLTALRAAQALFEPGMRKKFEVLGLPVHTNTDGKKKFEERQSRNRDKQEQRVIVHKNDRGKVIRVVRRADPEKGIKEKVLSGRKLPAEPTRVEMLKKIGPTSRMCIGSFCDTMLVNEGTSSFDEVKSAFVSHFPLLSSTERLTDSFFGRVLSAWYKEKYNTPLVRKKTKEMSDKNMTRAQVPYTDLSIRPASDTGVDLTQLNEAKVALRRALQMEGVGVLVKRDTVSGSYKVAMIAERSPASEEGSIQVGDTLISIGSEATSDMDVQQLADAVLGRRGTWVKLTLGRLNNEGALGVYTVSLNRRDKQSPALAPPQ
mmetsp:Transcript_24413/g.47418  ORF Transcript_24413/g.47418 Transcript_24413/m.47418 type:complete len:589 (+) Transcript_24413:146-1912(+)|eukprot:CAMPEP_0173383064 /NCGR_PEP_ID=MMETSP1356-20130122/5586_1 /TAXON_ID=77927 ORGANISM="Hemiselmis virescens, Strain PCC157" /NCGR_SAMPLE_ID=MMETSP1356 /ASSEMBLY_ACC=CAM_ASM_000847 /LENGTH=588 /DNA_ID=CAMNT_0014337719 /DNA_START=59 /DNA_END=1825 /DNA_ORIENTATION=+